MALHEGKLFVGDFCGGGVVYSEDNGETWVNTDIASLSYGEADPKLGKQPVENIYNLVSYNGELYAFGVYFVFRYDAATNAWETIASNSNFMAVSAIYQGTLCLGRSVINDSYDADFVVTLNKDGEWGALARPETYDNSIRAMHADGKHLFVGMQYNKLYHTSNGGETWQELSKNYPSGSVPMFIRTDDKYVNLACFHTWSNEGGLWRLEKSELEGEVITPGMRIPSAKAKITWRAQSLCENVMKGDTYEVRVSTTGNKPEDFVDAPVITIETETINQWTEHTADLSQYADQYVYIAFVNRTHAGEILAIDDIRISSSHSAYEVIRAIDTHVFGTEEHTLAGILRSNSVDGIKNFTACCVVDGKEYHRDFTDVDINSGEDYRFEFPETFSAAYGDTLHYRMWVDIEGYRPDTLDASFVSMLFRPARRTVAEEGTGMWCGYCPLGTVAMDRMKKKYPDTFIGIAAHYDDILEVEGYIRQFHLSSYPMFLVNRKYEADPMVLAQINDKTDYTTMEGAIETALLHEQSQVTTADVRLTSSEVDKMISVQAKACFAIHEDNADYRWAFVVVEDDMEDTKFYQANYMSGRTEYNLDGYENKAERIYPYTFNDVALSIAGQLNGFEGSVPTKLKAGETYTFQHQFEVSNMQNPNNVRIVAMLLDAQGHVVNATQTPLHTTGITTTPNDSSLAPIIGYYSLDGRRFSTPIRGINIIRRADGSTQKVIR